jgi:uncharacterized iron-regulated protein
MLAAGASAHMVVDSSASQRLYETQCLWDEYMADSAGQYITKYPSHTLVIIAGYGHVLGRGGIPNRIKRRVKKNDPFVIVPQQVDWLPNGLPDIEIPLSREDCDWAWYTEREIISA